MTSRIYVVCRMSNPRPLFTVSFAHRRRRRQSGMSWASGSLPT